MDAQAVSPNTSVMKKGLIAALVTVGLWTTWIIGTRSAVSGASPLDPVLLAFIRFGTATLVLAPFWWRLKGIPRQCSPKICLGLLFAGLPYQFMVLWGLHEAPASEAGPLLTGSLPFFVVAISLILGERVSRIRLAGVGLITLGALAITGSGLLAFDQGHWRGHLIILGAAMSWSIYTVAFRRSGLSAVQAAACVSLWSTLLLIPFGAERIVSALQATPLQALLQQVLLQGVVAGVLSLLTYTTAVKYLGPSRATAITALTPATATLAAVFILDEIPSLVEATGSLLIIGGVLLASGLF
jgi:drug/metabolite transporter (DMT)-like permease